MGIENTDEAKIEEIKQFLKNAKSLIKQGKYDFIPRRINLQGLAQLGLTLNLAKLALLQLSYRQYDRGPLPDTDRPADMVWEFIKEIDSQQAYIKIKIDRRGCVCLSFHPSNGPTSLPYKDS
ncbi:type II toxin-antitoxin system MqsR family toxin [Desulfosporosinus sp. BG]|uniref:type II toxin-antitoxin system MqsR family toxin n=1 Tax=Desulfosporosinus sp. BG TaxID=1633135 RepID=UPI000857C0E2|nr:type II toxin-antitoxin system MqsR family toxin [Desulfosporosinus sp. BG]ODA39171.1 hypothetical protein DSBG_4024 [Desulfosporosinus sp. BG]